jgi:hypothetical protein
MAHNHFVHHGPHIYLSGSDLSWTGDQPLELWMKNFRKLASPYMILHAVGSLNDVSIATRSASSPQGSIESGRVMKWCWAGRCLCRVCCQVRARTMSCVRADNILCTVILLSGVGFISGFLKGGLQWIWAATASENETFIFQRFYKKII